MNPEELRRLLDSGEITQEEYYTMLGDRSQSRDERGIPRGETFSRDVMSDPSITGRSPQPLIGRMSPRGFQRVPGGTEEGYLRLPPGELGTEYYGDGDERGFFDRRRDRRMERRFGESDGGIDSRGRLVPDSYQKETFWDGFNRTRFGDHVGDTYSSRGDGRQTQEKPDKETWIENRQEEMGPTGEYTYEDLEAEWEGMDTKGQEGNYRGRMPYERGYRGRGSYMGAPPLDATLYGAGAAFGEGRTGAGIMGSIGAGLGMARNFLSGFGAARQTQEGRREYGRISGMQDYENVDTNKNTNTRGGPGYHYEYGGEHKTPAERFNDIMTGKVGHYQNGGRTGDPEKDIKKTEQDPYGAVGITPEDRLHGKFLRIKQREVALPDGSTRMEPEVTDVDRVEGFKEKIRTMFGKEPTKPHLKVTHVYEDGGEIPEQSMEQPVPENEAEQDEILVIAQQLMEEFRTMEEMEAYLRDEGVEPQAIEMILQAVAMIAEEKGSQTEEPLPKSAVMRDTMSGGMDMENMGFKHGGRKYPKL